MGRKGHRLVVFSQGPRKRDPPQTAAQTLKTPASPGCQEGGGVLCLHRQRKDPPGIQSYSAQLAWSPPRWPQRGPDGDDWIPGRVRPLATESVGVMTASEGKGRTRDEDCWGWGRRRSTSSTGGRVRGRPKAGEKYGRVSCVVAISHWCVGAPRGSAMGLVVRGWDGRRLKTGWGWLPANAAVDADGREHKINRRWDGETKKLNQNVVICFYVTSVHHSFICFSSSSSSGPELPP